MATEKWNGIPIIDADDKPDAPPGLGKGYIPPTDAQRMAVQGMFAPPSEMEVYPQSEWEDRLKEQWERKQSLYHLWKIADNGRQPKVFSQGSWGYCHTADTEVLTENGFVPWPDYNWLDRLATVNQQTQALEYQRPFERHVYDYDGRMLYSTNRSVDFGVTPDHQMYVRRFDHKTGTLTPDYGMVRADDMGWYSGLLAAPAGQIGTEIVEVEIPGDRRYDGDDFFALLGLIVSDGFAGGAEKTRNLVSFASFRAESREAVAALAHRAGFKEQPSRPGVYNRWSGGPLADWLRENAYEGGATGAHAKRVPAIVKWASPRQIKLFLQWFDDRERDGGRFYSASKGLIDDLQELHLRIGVRSTVTVRDGKTTPYEGNRHGCITSGRQYVLTVRRGEQLSIERRHNIEEDRYRGPVYCAGVPNHTLITRRNGTTLISSNCWAYSTVNALMMARCAAGMPFVRLSAHSVAWTIRNGRNQGGWCGESAKFLAERGVVPESTWPNQGSRNYGGWEEAKKYRIDEEYRDPARPIHGQMLNAAQIITCALNNHPMACDDMEWAHSVCYPACVVLERGVIARMGWNSWAGWGDEGWFISRSQRLPFQPDGAIAIRTVTAT